MNNYDLRLILMHFIYFKDEYNLKTNVCVYINIYKCIKYERN